MEDNNIFSRLKTFLSGKKDICEASPAALKAMEPSNKEDEPPQEDILNDNNKSPEKIIRAKEKAAEQMKRLKTKTSLELKKMKDKASEDKQDMKDIIDHFIKPEERTLKNYLSLNFWKQKNREYQKLKEKEKQDLNVYQVLSAGARPSIEYYALTILSCIIATTGLIQGSTAVIIGAMIVAPLMTPILASSLGIIWGDLRLINTSVRSILIGTILAVAISSLIAYAVPLPEFHQEIIARTRPSLFDILVAIASGIVGAYGYANKKISNSIIGIAIAVALMPPVCTVGIGLGTFNMDIATGAFVLYVINLVSISLTASIIFWIMKIHPILADEEGVKKRAIYQIILSLTLLIAIAVPIGIYMYHGYNRQKGLKLARETIKTSLPELTILNMEIKSGEGGNILFCAVMADSIPDSERVKIIKEKILKNFKDISRIEVRFLQSMILLE